MPEYNQVHLATRPGYIAKIEKGKTYQDIQYDHTQILIIEPDPKLKTNWMCKNLYTEETASLTESNIKFFYREIKNDDRN